MLRPFWEHPGFCFEPDFGLDWEVFQRQWRQREAFRHWQLDNRGIMEEDDFEVFVLEKKKWLLENHLDNGVAEIEANPESLKKPAGAWELRQATNTRRRRRDRELGCHNFLEYHAALKKRLSDHGFKDKVALLEDPKTQDPLTEWHEYLGFECWWQDEFNREHERRRKAYDEKWEYIESQNWVASHETPEYLDSWDGVEERHAAVSKAREAVDEAKLNVEQTQQRIGTEGVVSGQRTVAKEKMDAALQKLAEAEAKPYDADHRNRIIGTLSAQTHSCECAKLFKDSQAALVKWAMDQVPLIKAEMKTKANNNGAVSGAVSSKRKRIACTGEEEASGRTSPKLQKSAKPERKALGEPKASPLGLSRRCAKPDANQVSPSIAQPRRSARLATKENPAAATTKPTPVKNEVAKESLQTTTKSKSKRLPKSNPSWSKEGSAARGGSPSRRHERKRPFTLKSATPVPCSNSHELNN